MRPSLTVIAQAVEQIGRTAAMLLLETIGGSEGANRHIVLPPELRVRDSSRQIYAKRSRALGPPPLPSELTAFEKTITQSEDTLPKPNEVFREEAMLRVMQSAVLSAALLMTGAYGSPAAESPGLSGEITVWDWNYETETWGKALKQVDAEFLALHPGVTIKHVAQPHANYYQLWQTANSAQRRSRRHPDARRHVRRPHLSRVARAAERPHHAGDAGLASKAGSRSPATSIPTARSTAIPGNLSGWVFYYNKALFAQAGIDRTPPKTWDDLVAAARSSRPPASCPSRSATPTSSGTLQYLNIIFPGNFTMEESIALANGEIKYNGEQFTSVNQHLLDIIEAGYFDPGFASMLQWTDAVDSFAAASRR